ncbi:hypothetical protein [Escherichia coli]|uniref:hypothetical protein n=1 Tax=Escherichia coli TaxID=562 RepID=UPI003013DED4
MSMTTELAQIKCDIAARKAMPGFGPDTSIERLRIINATQKSFSLETVEALVEALEASEKRNAELEVRTVKLPQRLTPEGYRIDEAYMVDDDEGEYLDRDDVIAALSAAGVAVEGVNNE